MKRVIGRAGSVLGVGLDSVAVVVVSGRRMLHKLQSLVENDARPHEQDGTGAPLPPSTGNPLFYWQTNLTNFVSGLLSLCGLQLSDLWDMIMTQI